MNSNIFESKSLKGLDAMSKIKAVMKQVLLFFLPLLRILILYENLVKKHCTIGVVSPPSFMRRIVLAIFWAEYWGRSPG